MSSDQFAGSDSLFNPIKIDDKFYLREFIAGDYDDLLATAKKDGFTYTGLNNYLVKSNAKKPAEDKEDEYVKMPVEKNVKAYLEEALTEQRKEPRRGIYWAICTERSDEEKKEGEGKQDKVIGAVEFISPGEKDKDQAVELAYYLDPAYHKTGLMTKAVCTVLPPTVENLGITSMKAVAYTENKPSHKVLEKFGFQLLCDENGNPKITKILKYPGDRYQFKADVSDINAAIKRLENRFSPIPIDGTDGKFELTEFKKEDESYLLETCHTDGFEYGGLNRRYEARELISTEEGVTKYLDEAINAQTQEPRKEALLAIRNRATKEVVGAVEVLNVNDKAYLAYYVDPKHQRKKMISGDIKPGLALKAICAALPVMIEKLNITDMWASAAAENVAGWSLLEKLGFERRVKETENANDNQGSNYAPGERFEYDVDLAILKERISALSPANNQQRAWEERGASRSAARSGVGGRY